MNTLRKYFCWLFAFISFVCLHISVMSLLKVPASQRAIQKHVDLWVAVIMFLLCVVYAFAWWTNLRARNSARGWALVANSISFLAPIWPLVTSKGPALMGLKFVIGVGAAGILIFARRMKPVDPRSTLRDILPLKGDFTLGLINKHSETFIFLVSLTAYFWWSGWCKSVHVPPIHDTSPRIALTLVLLLLLTTVHEFGHALAGVATGMKLRAFFIGPFQWTVRAGKWVFRFSPKGIFLPEGVTGIVPSTASMPRSHFLAMTAAGPLANIITGSIALILSSLIPASWTSHTAGMITLFGAWSLALAAGNLLPFRTKSGYSDGALILQLLSSGPFADFQMAVASIGSSLVSPVRPRDYDLQAIRRAAEAIPEGRQALLLRLYAFQHLLDAGKFQQAEETLREAAEICSRSAADVPAEAHATLVFGFAVVAHDAAAARKWWNRIEARNAKPVTAEQMRARTALHLIEGNLAEADKAWQQSDALARKLPKAGAYDFGRHLCSLLRQCLDDAQAAAA